MNILSVFDGSYNDLIDAIDTAAKMSNDVMYTGAERDIENIKLESFPAIFMIVLAVVTRGQSVSVNMLSEGIGYMNDTKGFVDKYRELEKSGADFGETVYGMADYFLDYLRGKIFGKTGSWLGGEVADAVFKNNKYVKTVSKEIGSWSGGETKDIVDEHNDTNRNKEDEVQ